MDRLPDSWQGGAWYEWLTIRSEVEAASRLTALTSDNVLYHSLLGLAKLKEVFGANCPKWNREHRALG
jgi:hypothetical protein